MADEKTADAASGGNKKKKLLLIGAATAVVVLALAVTAWFLFGPKGAEEEGAVAAKVPAAAPAAIYASLGEKFVVTLQEQGRQRYFQTSLSALTRDQAVVKALELHAPLIRARLVALLGEQDFAALRTEAGKVALRDRILATLQEVLQAETGAPGVEQVFFTEFVLQ
jgi:flagellar protein FliL